MSYRDIARQVVTAANGEGCSIDAMLSHYALPKAMEKEVRSEINSIEREERREEVEAKKKKEKESPSTPRPTVYFDSPPQVRAGRPQRAEEEKLKRAGLL